MKKIKLSDFNVIPLVDTARHEDISDELYFADYQRFITASKLHRISPRRGGSMEKFYHPEPFGWSEALERGTAIHQLTLQPESFKLIDSPVGKPSAKLGATIDAIRKHRKAGKSIAEAIDTACTEIGYYVGKEAIQKKKLFTKDNLTYYIKSLSFTDDLVVPSDREYPVVKKCVHSLTHNPVIFKQLHPTDVFGDPLPSYCEDTLYLDFKVTYKGQEHILHFKGKADNYSLDPDNKILILNDVKTSSEPVDLKWIEEGGHFDAFAYDSQMAIYQTALEALAAKEWGYDPSWRFRCHIWAVHTRDSYMSRCFTINEDWLAKGKKTYEDCLKMIAYYEMFGTPEHLPEEEVEFVD